MYVLASCGGDTRTDSDESPSSGTAAVPTVIATTTVWADVTRNVACDGLVNVDTVVPPGGDPHAFEPSLRDRESMDRASVIVANGLGLEESMIDTLDAVEADGVAIVRVGEYVDTLPSGDEDHDHESETGIDDHEHGPDDPHIWFDSRRVSATLAPIADALADAGVDRDALDACVATYTETLATLDASVDTIVSVLPAAERLLVTNHDSLSYFADRYGFDILGSVIPSPSSLSATNPAELEALANLIQETDVPAIFAETQHSSADTKALAERVGDVRVVTLQTDTLGPPGSDTDTYVEWLTLTARTVVDALHRPT
jgi:zinc/manganese transport system substrate-binding protein